MLFNTGREPVLSKHGLLTTVAYKLGADAIPSYALEVSEFNKPLNYHYYTNYYYYRDPSLFLARLFHGFKII
jgi:hypothetical protein